MKGLGQFCCRRRHLLLFALICVTLCHKVAAATTTCNPMALVPCAPAMNTPAQPTAQCCRKLKEQQPCFCQYAKNPTLRKYITSPNSGKVSAACIVPFPHC